VKVPAGIQDGQKIKLRGKGQASPNGGEPGDLLISVKVKPHPVFVRDGNNLRVNVPVTFAEAVLGATIQVPTLGGEPVKLKVAPGTPNGRVLRVKGKGVQSTKGEGDLLATVDIAVKPPKASARAATLRRSVPFVIWPTSITRSPIATKCMQLACTARVVAALANGTRSRIA
jgi:molecular chaperone DnaJ